MHFIYKWLKKCRFLTEDHNACAPTSVKVIARDLKAGRPRFEVKRAAVRAALVLAPGVEVSVDHLVAGAFQPADDDVRRSVHEEPRRHVAEEDATRKRHPLVLSFPYVRPEPCLVN
jgi:hypothetical protein